MHWLALDIGGANLKMADGKGYADSCAFALWKEPQRLAQELRTLIAEGPPSDHLVVTMTGELADCFDDKATGVRFILRAMHDAADGRHTRVYLSNGTMVTPQIAQSKPHLAAAANWHALARFAGRFAKKGPALLIDIGSTTSDIVPLVDGVPATPSQSDTERLLAGELVYTGVERSPVCALVDDAPYRGQSCPLAQELFATTLDVYLILGDIAENAVDLNTADRRPATKAAARNRLGRMICADGDEFNHRDAVAIAQAVSQAQIAKLAVAAEQVIARLPSPPETIVLSGHGEFLARRMLEATSSFAAQVSLAKELGRSVSRCATAHALAVLAREAAGA